MIVYGWIEIFFMFVFLFQKIRLLWHSLMCFEAKSAMDNKLSMTLYKCILIFKVLWTTKEGQQESANYWGRWTVRPAFKGIRIR